MHKKDLADVTRITQTNKTMAGQLKTLMADDVPWSTLLDDLRSTGAANGVTVTSVNAMTVDAQASNSKAAAAAKDAIATLTIGGSANDKKTAAAFIDALIGVKGVANPYLTTATQSGTSSDITFTANAEVTSAALCGRYTTACTTGGK